MDKLKEVEKKIQDLILSYKDKDLDIIFLLTDGNQVLISGNTCLVCAKEILDVFIDKNGIKHDGEKDEEVRKRIH